MARGRHVCYNGRREIVGVLASIIIYIDRYRYGTAAGGVKSGYDRVLRLTPTKHRASNAIISKKDDRI